MLVIAISNNLSAVRWTHSESSDIEPISIKFTFESVSFILGGFYRPPGSPESYLLALQTSIYTLPQNSSIFICAWRFQYT